MYGVDTGIARRVILTPMALHQPEIFFGMHEVRFLPWKDWRHLPLRALRSTPPVR